MDPTITSTTPETQCSKKMSNIGNDLDKKPRKRQRIKRHRPKIWDESTPRKTPKSRIEPSTPKPKTPRHTIPTSSPHKKYVRKDSGKIDTSIYGDRQATDRSSGCAEKPCRRALRFNLENHLIIQKDGEEAVTFTEEHNNYERKDDVKFLGFSLQNFDNRALFPNSDCATELCMNLVNEKSKIRARNSFGEMSRQAANPNPEQRESSCKESQNYAFSSSCMDGNGKPKMVYSYQRRNKSLSTFSCKLDFNLNLEQQYFDSCSELEKIVHEYKSGEKRIHKSAYKGELNANSETENLNMCDEMKNEPGVDSNLQSCYRFGSLQVYQRIFKLNECLKNSRKLGPNCPSIYKKTRMQRRKATTFGGFWNATTVDHCQRKVNPSCRKEVALSYGACRTINKTGKQRLSRRLTQKAMLERGKNIKGFSITAISKCNFPVQLGQRGTKQKSEANKDPESFKWVLNSWKTWGCRRKRLFNRRQKLASSVVHLDMASQTKAVIVHPEFLGCALKSKRERYNKFSEKIDLSSSGVHNEDIHRRQRKSLYDVELSVGNLVSRLENIQNSHMQCDDFVLGVQIYPPRQSLEIEMLKNQPAKDQSLETQNINEMGPFLHKTVSYHDNILECPLQCRNGLIEIPVCYQQREDIMLKSVQHQENVALDFEGKHQVPKDVSPIINEDAFTKAMVKLVIEMLERLHISNECNQLVKRDQNTHSELIPYNGKLDPLKRRKPPPPKVDFERETVRFCNLLMDNHGSEVPEEVDKDNAKSRKEREMFCGRTNTFIACMHAIQGNRRFSRWGGSVVDSVVGVYLTQNVSDNCSSSAFMSLAASFPPVSKDTDCKENIVCGHKSVNIEEPRIPENKGQSYVYPTEQDMGYQFVENGESHIFSTGKAVPGSMEDEVIVKDAVQGFPDASRDENLTNISASCSTDKSTTYREFLLVEEIEYLQQFCGPQDGKISCQESFGELQSMKDAFSSDTSGLNGTCALHSSASLPHFDDNLDSVHHVGDSGNGRMEESSDISNLDQRNYFESETVIREKDTQRIQEPLIAQMSSSSKFHEAVMTKNNSFCGSKSPAVVNPNDYQGINNANNYRDGNKTSSRSESASGRKKGKVEPETQTDWDALRKTHSDGRSRNTTGPIDSANWEAVRKASVEEVAKVIAARGMNNILAGRIKDFLDRIVKDHGSIDLEWLRNVPPDKAKEYLLSIPGLGLKSVECLRLLTLHHVAFPVDTNVGRIVVRLGWVPLQPLPEDVQIHLLNQYPLVDAIQKYLWPRLCTLDQQTLYQLHYQMITFGKVFCTKKKPNCNACPMRGQCRHFASAFASARLRLPGPQEKNIIISEASVPADQDPVGHRSLKLLPVSDDDFFEGRYESRNCEPIVEVPASPEPISSETLVTDIEDFGYESEDKIPIIRLNAEEFQENLRNVMEITSFSHKESDMSKEVVALSPEAASIPVPKLKDVHRLRTVHQVYELPDLHPLLVEFEKREPDDPSPYLLRTWTTDEMVSSSQLSRKTGNTQDATPFDACFSGDTVQEQNDQTVKGTILIPCRTATRGTFPLNGTYFQVNEVFADHKSSRCPIAVPRESIWNLKKRSLYCGKSATSIFKGMSTEEIQFCFWKAFVCVRGVDRVTRDARPLSIKFHRSKNKHANDEE